MVDGSISTGGKTGRTSSLTNPQLTQVYVFIPVLVVVGSLPAKILPSLK
jgi:hypothetical protein